MRIMEMMEMITANGMRKEEMEEGSKATAEHGSMGIEITGTSNKGAQTAHHVLTVGATTCSKSGGAAVAEAATMNGGNGGGGMLRHRNSSANTFAILVAGSLIGSAGFTVLQEGVFRHAGFKYAGIVTLSTQAVFTAAAFVEILSSSRAAIRHRQAQWSHYFVAGIFNFGGMYLTNVSLNYIHYILRVVFKSSRLLPVMVMGLVLQGRSYTITDYSAALALIFSIVFFALGSNGEHPHAHHVHTHDGTSTMTTSEGKSASVDAGMALFGVALITIATFLDAIYANYVEKYFFRRRNPSSRSEVIAYTGLVSMMYTFIAVVLNGELVPGLHFFASHSSVALTLFFASVGGYLSLNCNVLVTKLYDCTRTEVVKSSRKIVTVAISFIVYPKPLNIQYLLGALCLVLSVWMKHGSSKGSGVGVGGVNSISSSSTSMAAGVAGSKDVGGTGLSTTWLQHQRQCKPDTTV